MVFLQKRLYIHTLNKLYYYFINLLGEMKIIFGGYYDLGRCTISHL